MSIFSFIGYTLAELFRKPNNWRQIYKQTSSTFYTSNDLLRRTNNQYVIARFRNSCLIAIAIFKNYRSSHRRYRSIHQRYSVKEVFIKISPTSQETPFLMKLQSFRLQVFKKRLQHKCFSVKFAKLLRIPMLRNICKRLLLEVVYK